MVCAVLSGLSCILFEPLSLPLQALTDQCLQQLAELQADRDQLLLDSAALAADLGVCATNLQSVVATVAFSVSLAPEVQQGLNAKDQAAFDTCLEGLHEVSGLPLSGREIG